jgi:DNA-binding transcriptional regulator YdaS (Cro superfamily)
MELKDWLTGGYGRVTMLARGVNVPVSFVSKIKLGKKPIPASLCPSIEEFTERAVMCEEMRPDVKWHVLRDGPRSMNAPAADAAVSIQVTDAAPAAANDEARDAPGRA